ncbi:MAG: RdgB/HAM1 family non-canonical purine NTP pyrophosphatase [Candidatus Omnitrophica bacterium]|nr:RdgB/HAM1 family non-canonical purine NTP pyrophosphatase [Candidatus Omnitrophota bacterium]
MREIVIATKNEKKLHELKRYLKGVDAKVVSLKNFTHVPRIVENGVTFKANAVKKALVISRFTKGLVIADDSGLAVNALGGRPGVRSSRFAGPRKSDKQNNKKLLEILKKTPPEKRQARFVCAAAICDNNKVLKVIEESCAGVIAFSEKGGYGFGYDSLFLIPKYKKTFGELGLKVKDKMSHRSKALKKVREFLKKYL